MIGVLTGFGVIFSIVVLGYLIGRGRLLGEGALEILTRLAFFVLSPALLFTVLAESDVHALFSALLPVSVVAALVTLAMAVAIALIGRRRRDVPTVTVSALSAAYTNANFLGIPLTAYILGDAAYSAPVILFQLIVLAPLGLAILDLSTGGRPSIGRILLQPIRNPLIIGSALGVALAVLGIELPRPVMDPFEIVGGAAVPVVLLTFGIALHGQRPLEAGTDRGMVVAAVVLKLVVMPAAAFAVGRWFGLDQAGLFVVTALAALPTGQNIFNFAQRYRRGEIIARDTLLLTTAGSVFVLLAVAALLAPG